MLPGLGRRQPGQLAPFGTEHRAEPVVGEKTATVVDGIQRHRFITWAAAARTRHQVVAVVLALALSRKSRFLRVGADGKYPPPVVVSGNRLRRAFPIKA